MMTPRRPFAMLANATFLLLAAVVSMTFSPSTALAQWNADLVGVTTTVVDAVREYRLSASQHRDKVRLRDQRIISEEEVALTSIRLETADLQLNLLRGLLEAEREIAGNRADELLQLRQSGRSAVSPAEVAAMQFRMKFHERLLQTVDEVLKPAAPEKSPVDPSAGPK